MRLGRSGWAGVLAAAVVGLAGAGPASASTDRVTRGEAEAVLGAYGTGGQILRSDGTFTSGAPADADIEATIRPFGASDGRHYCADDWHVIVIALLDGGDASYTRAEAEAVLLGYSVTFTLDGAPLDTSRTSIKPYLDSESSGADVAYWFQQGVVMSPESLSVGRHTLAAAIDGVPGKNHPVTLRSRFYIDASGTGACL